LLQLPILSFQAGPQVPQSIDFLFHFRGPINSAAARFLGSADSITGVVTMFE